MSTTTIAIDSEIRDKAAQKAELDHLSVSAVARILLSDYAEGKIVIGTKVVDDDFKVEMIEVNSELQDMMDKVVEHFDKNEANFC